MRAAIITTHVIITIITAFCFSSACAESLLRVCDITEKPSTLNPFKNIDIKTTNILRHILGPWVDRNKAGEIVGGIFKDWRQQSDTVWIFTLQEGLKFHDGSPFTPEDAVFSISRAVSDGSALAKEFATVKSAKAVSENSISVETKVPDPILLSRFLGRVFSVSERILRELGENQYFENPIGVGPYRFVSVDREKLILKKNHLYFKTVKGTEIIEWHFIKDKNERVRAIKDDKVDIVTELPVEFYHDLRKTSGISVRRVLTNQYLALFFNAIPELKGIFQDIALRKAVVYGVDINEIRNSEFGPIPSQRIPTIVTANDFGFNSKLRVRKSDKDYAKKLLRQHLKKKGTAEPLKLKIATVDYLEDICDNIRKQLEQIGTEVKITALSRSDLIRRVIINKEIQTDAFLVDPYNVLSDAEFQMMIHYGGGITSWYFDPELQEILSQAREEMNPEKRKLMLMKAQEMVYHDYATLPVYQKIALYAVSERAKNFNVLPDVFLRLENVVTE